MLEEHDIVFSINISIAYALVWTVEFHFILVTNRYYIKNLCGFGDYSNNENKH